MVPQKRRFGEKLSQDVWIALCSLAAYALYLIIAWLGQHRFGFPLDDAWIHQAYARNLTQSGQWSFVPGVPSTGSTSILWTLLLTPGHWLPFAARWWTHLMGWASLTAAAMGAARLARLIFGDAVKQLPLVVGLAAACEWHLVWAGASGMETAFFAAAVTWYWVWALRHDTSTRWQDGLLLGLFGGGLMLVRPEGVLALAVAGMYGLLTNGPIKKRIVWAAAAGVGFAAALGVFFGFNALVGGAIWPNTFFAKQTEYAVLWEQPYLLRLWQQMSVMWIGGQALLIPAFFIGLWRILRERPVRWAAFLPLLWALAHWALYALRLPVTYQHGRYAMATVPVVVIYGVGALLQIVKPSSEKMLVRVGSRVWLLSAALSFAGMLAVLGAPAYGRDVAFVESEMVETAQWVAANTGPDDLIAAHDIGALGYFAPRPLLDLAGLVSPEVIPFMSDPERLTDYIVSEGADYLIVFPQWSPAYAEMIDSPVFEPVWSTAESPGYAAPTFLGPMTVYRVQP